MAYKPERQREMQMSEYIKITHLESNMKELVIRKV